MFYLNLKRSKSGHQKMQIPIMLSLKAKSIHTAPPGNSYNKHKKLRYLNFVVEKKWKQIKK